MGLLRGIEVGAEGSLRVEYCGLCFLGDFALQKGAAHYALAQGRLLFGQSFLQGNSTVLLRKSYLFSDNMFNMRYLAISLQYLFLADQQLLQGVSECDLRPLFRHFLCEPSP